MAVSLNGSNSDLFLQGMLSVVEKAINLREKEMAFSVLLRLSTSLAVHNMTSLKGLHSS